MPRARTSAASDMPGNAGSARSIRPAKATKCSASAQATI
jgi:hypothetical protein